MTSSLWEPLCNQRDKAPDNTAHEIANFSVGVSNRPLGFRGTRPNFCYRQSKLHRKNVFESIFNLAWRNEISKEYKVFFVQSDCGDVGSGFLIKKPQNWHIGLLICSYCRELLKLFLWAFSRFSPFNERFLIAFSGRWTCSFLHHSPCMQGTHFKAN